jgi:hypothetical protein
MLSRRTSSPTPGIQVRCGEFQDLSVDKDMTPWSCAAGRYSIGGALHLQLQAEVNHSALALGLQSARLGQERNGFVFINTGAGTRHTAA